MAAYYNEIDPFAAAWLRNLIVAGLIAPGEVDERSIADVHPVDLFGFRQCHFFAGIGVWSYALRCAGWPDDREVWTGSCPCQPFSAAGKRAGTADERHLWPVWFPLIEQRRPAVVFGEQVAGKDGAAWLDLVSADLERAAYAFGAVVSPASGYGAPHIRHRTYFVANADGSGPGRRPAGAGRQARLANERYAEFASALADDDDGGQPQLGGARLQRQHVYDSDGRGELGALGLADLEGPQRRGDDACEYARQCVLGPASFVGGFWSGAEWLPCTDGKARPIEPGTFPLAYGVANRVGKLRGYGNGLVAPQAQAFIEAAMECLP